MRTYPPFDELTAQDLMSPEVVVFRRDTPLVEAAQLLARKQISGAPVVDAQGRCVGVISAGDFIKWASHGSPPRAEATCMPAYCADWQMVDMTRLPGTPVAEHMTTDLVTAEPATPIRDLAWRMMEAHVHRIVILDEAGRPMGLVSSTDILAAVAHAPRGVAVEAGR